MLNKYKEAFSLRDEIGSCSNIEVEIDVTDKSPFSVDHTMYKKMNWYWIGDEKIVLFKYIEERFICLF